MFDFHDYDTHLLVRRTGNVKVDSFSLPKDVKNIMDAIRRLLVKNGYSVYRDPDIRKKHPILNKYHLAGHKGDLKFVVHMYPMGLDLEFYQDINFENPHGGKYDFSKFEKMPYLIKQQFILIKNKIFNLLRKRKLQDNVKPKLKYAFDKVQARRREIEAFHGVNFYSKPIESYNNKDQDGNELKDGDERYFYDYNRKLCRGKIYYNLNNMWWVVCNNFYYSNIASFHLFQWKPDMPLRKVDKEKALKVVLDKSIKEMNFEKAIVIRDILKKEVPSAELCTH